MHVAMYIHAYFSNCMHIYMTYSNCICMMVYVMYIHFRICIHTWHIHGLEYTWHFLFQSCSNLAIIDVDWFSISNFTNTTWRFIGMWDWIYMCASSFVLLYDQILMFLWYIHVHGLVSCYFGSGDACLNNTGQMECNFQVVFSTAKVQGMADYVIFLTTLYDIIFFLMVILHL
jgi:hypothetical protein